MASPTISEFSFGYALTAELVHTYNAKAGGAPIFPSLVQEASLGYDVAIPGVPVFLQFKLADHLRSSNAGEWSLFDAPYFRMKLYRRDKSQQHARLLALEASGENVLYASPMFSSPTALSSAYTGSMVEQRTAFWRPSDIGPLPDNKQHHICYREGQTYGYFCSDPQKVPMARFSQTALKGRITPQQSSNSQDGGARGADDDLNKFYEKLVSVRIDEDARWGRTSPEVVTLAQMAAARPPLLKVELAARLLYQSTLLFI